MSTGKVINVPPPAMELITPAAKAAATIMSIFDINWFLASEFQVAIQLGSATDAEPRAVVSGCQHAMLNPAERSIHC